MERNGRKRGIEKAVSLRHKRHTIKRGETLKTISQKYLKSANRWREIYEANRNRIRNPNRIFYGQVIIVPLSGSPG